MEWKNPTGRIENEWYSNICRLKICPSFTFVPHLDALQWRHDERDGVSNQQPHDCLFNRLFRRRWKKTWKLRVTGLCEGNSSVTGEFPSQRARNAENVPIWWRHHVSDQKMLPSHADWDRVSAGNVTLVTITGRTILGSYIARHQAVNKILLTYLLLTYLLLTTYLLFITYLITYLISYLIIY